MAGGRPGLRPGTFGDIAVSSDGQPYKARARFCRKDGRVVYVARFGQTKSQARDRLRLALADMQAANAPLSGDTRIVALADEWLEDVLASDLAEGTKEVYSYAVDLYVKKRVGTVKVRDFDTGAADAALKSIAAQHGPGAAKTARAVLNGMLSRAVRQGALTVSPMREVEPIRGGTRKSPRALTVDETNQLTDWLRADRRALELDLPDLIEFMLGTGVRIGEALAVRDSVLDKTAGTVEINATVKRTKRTGLTIQERPKSAAGWRVLALPPFLTEMIGRRDAELRFRDTSGVVFPSPYKRALRDPSNTQSDIREVLDRIGCPTCSSTGKVDGQPCPDVAPLAWVTSHVFRKTVVTRLDEAGWTARQIADQVGHSQPSMTQNVYMGRRVVNSAAATVLDR